MWGLGCLVWESFNGRLTGIARLKSLDGIPKSLVTAYASLMTADPSSRPEPNAFIDACRRPGRFMATPYVDAMLFLHNIEVPTHIRCISLSK